MSSITLSSSVRNAMLSLSNTMDSVSKNQSRLSTGNRINTAIDGPPAYFSAKSLNDRARDLTDRKSQIDQGISVIGAALTGASSIESTLTQMKGIVKSAATADEATRETLKTQYNDLLKSIDKTAGDSSYNGVNLLNGGDVKLTVQFGDSERASQSVQAKNLSTSKDGLNLQEITGFGSTTEELDAMGSKLDGAINTVRASAKELGSNVALLQMRADFTKDYVATLEEGSRRLTVADLSSEGANLMALQTRQQLGVQSLSFANQSQQAVMQLFR